MTDECDPCRLEVGGLSQNPGTNRPHFYVGLQCRDCGRAEVRHVEADETATVYAGWAT